MRRTAAEPTTEPIKSAADKGLTPNMVENMEPEKGAPAPKRIGVVAPARRITEVLAETVDAAVKKAFAGNLASAPELVFHPQCFMSDGHFAGSDSEREAAFVEIANDPSIDAVWFAKGGYGSCRLRDQAFAALTATAATKTYLGYSDLGVVLARLYRMGIGRQAHGPMPGDIVRDGGEAAVARAARWLALGEPAGLEASPRPSAPVAAFNITVLAHLVGVRDAVDFTGHVVMLEDVGEYLYALDRSFFTILMSEAMRGAAGVMLGRISDVPENDTPFAKTPEEIARYWCDRAGVPFLGAADIGHDSDNKIVIFGR